MKKHSCLLLLLLFGNFFSYCFASVEVIGSLKQVYTTNRGEVVKGQIMIQNSDSTDQQVRIYQTDMLYNFQDQTFYDEPGVNKRSNANWVKYSPKTLTLKSKETRNIEYEISAPDADSIKGTYWSCMMIEGVSPIDPTKSDGLSIRTVTRYAVQLVNEMQDKGKGLLTFFDPTLVKGENNTLFLAVDIQNNGDRFIAPDVSMELYDDKGNSVKTIKAEKRGLYPTTSVRFRLDLAGLPSKKTYTAMIVAAGQEEDVFGIEYTLFF